MTDSEVDSFLSEIDKLNRKVARLERKVEQLTAENKALKQATERVMPDPIFYREGKPLKGRPRK